MVEPNGDVGAGDIETETVTLKIPGWFAKPVVLLLLLYRRLRYGYAFRKILLTQDKFAIVDLEDYYRLKKYKWHLLKSSSNLYAARSIRTNGKRGLLMMHREILNVPDNLVVDHINHNGLDNRKANLRPATMAQNTWNRYIKPHSSKFKGVSWNKSEKKWQVHISSAYKNIHLGYYDNEIEAAKAYDKAAKKLRGKFAVLNFSENQNSSISPLLTGKSGEG